MQYTQKESHISKEDYFVVFDKNKNVKFGIASLKEKQKIENAYPNQYRFEEFDFDEDLINLKNLEENQKYANGLTFERKMLLISIAILVILILAGLIWPEKYSFIYLSVNSTV